jgi:hypothetical protein
LTRVYYSCGGADDLDIDGATRTELAATASRLRYNQGEMVMARSASAKVFGKGRLTGVISRGEPRKSAWMSMREDYPATECASTVCQVHAELWRKCEAIGLAGDVSRIRHRREGSDDAPGNILPVRRFKHQADRGSLKTLGTRERYEAFKFGLN